MSTQTAYQYDSAGLYLGTTVADESPMEPGVYLLPAGCTLTAPPEASAGHTPRWNGTAWQLVPTPATPPAPSALDKLQAFLAQNPDVQALVATQATTPTPAPTPAPSAPPST